MVRRADAAEGKVQIALVGKYVQLADAYKSVIEALEHGGIHHGVEVEVELVDSEDFDPERLEGADGILIPGGFGERGIEGKVAAARIARERSIPYLGICLGHADRGGRVRPHASPAWTAPTRPSSIPRRRSRSSTCCPSRRRSPTWAARCGSAPTR